MIILKSVKTHDRRKNNNDDKNMVQIHDEQRSIEMTILQQRSIQMAILHLCTQKHCSDKHCDYK